MVLNSANHELLRCHDVEEASPASRISGCKMSHLSDPSAAFSNSFHITR
jgi:hypothetical protein